MGVSQGVASSIWNTCRGRGYFDWGYSNTLRVLSEERIWLVQICSYCLECPRHRGLGQCSLGLITSSEFGISTMTTFPWVIVPTVGVPIALMLHGITLYRIRST